MRKFYTLLAAVLFAATVFLPQQASAQAPEKMSYQAVIRNSSDALVINTTIGMQISILQGSASGTVVYTETQTPTTNANGLISIEIGTGTSFDDLSAINWANSTYFIKTETDPTGGTSYNITGTSQLLSVPYALYAKYAENSIPGPQGLAGTDGLTTSVNGVTQVAGEIILNKADMGLGNVDNTTDLEKPIGTVTQTALDLKVDKDGTKVLSSNDYTDADKANLDTNTAKTGITTEQADEIAANTAKVGLTPGTTPGQMQYWDGTAWVVVATTANEAAILQMIGGVPTWTGGTPPSTAPGAPTVGTASAGNAQATVTYTAPASDGGSTITEYIATSSPDSITGTLTQAGSGTITVTGLTEGTAYTFKVTATNAIGTSVASASSNLVTILPSFAIGSSYGGGIIAYILQSGDAGYVAGEKHGLIAAPSDQSAGIQWYNDENTETDATATAIGTGNANTNAIVEDQDEGNYAAQLCTDLVLDGYSDWYLPSKDELNKLYQQKTAVGGFASANYWSSSESNSSIAWSQNFNGSGAHEYVKYFPCHVRAIRAF